MRSPGMALAGVVLALAAVNLLVGLGSSSLFVDEGISWSAASAPSVRQVVERVADGEVSPPLHYVALHEIIGRIADSEVAMRLPSALAGIAVAAATMWLGTLVAGRLAGLVAGGLAALSPLVLEYGQQARSYVFTMLAATVLAGALVKAERSEPGGRRRRAWLAVVAAMAVLGFWTHYTLALVCVPLLASSVARRALRRNEAIGLASAIGAGWLVVLPVLLEQVGKGRTNELGHLAFLSFGNVVEIFGAPFDTRFDFFDLTPAAAVGALTVVAAGALALARPLGERPLVRSLILPAAFVPVAAVIFMTIVGEDVLLTRYVAAAVPLMLVLLGATAGTARPAVAGVILALAGASALVGSVLGHTEGGRYADWRAATEVIARDDRRGDAVILNHDAIGGTYAYHAARAEVRDLPARGRTDPKVVELLRTGRRLWVSIVFPPARAEVSAALRRLGYRMERDWRFEGAEPLELILALPREGARTRFERRG